MVWTSKKHLPRTHWQIYYQTGVFANFCGDFNLNVIEQTKEIDKVLHFSFVPEFKKKNRSEPTRNTSCTATCFDFHTAIFQASVDVKDAMIFEHKGVELNCK